MRNEKDTKPCAVSATSGIRADLQDIVQRYLADKVEMVELDYQPDE